ncbi:unnamed protein product [Allacma fusca]|uniref:Uncharacterized protein n=2 Tax=Allacma fusca TaxID=39272 RepID=A0A8J2K5S4_9HEXA|nr:unnamed protein product [Allacma fusca]
MQLVLECGSQNRRNNFVSIFLVYFFLNSKMRQVFIFVVLATLLVGAMTMPFPQYLEEAVRQAQAMQLLPPYAVVDKTAPGIQVAYFKLGPNDRVDLQNALGGAIPSDVVASLESQVDSIGKNY